MPASTLLTRTERAEDAFRDHAADVAVSFKTADAARHFLKQLVWESRPTPLSGSSFWSSEKWVETADRIARQMVRQPADRWGTGAQRVAKLMRGYRKGGGARFSGVRCDCCGTILSNPESVAAGRGPKCMEDGRSPVASFAQVEA